MSKAKAYASVWDAAVSSPEQAANLLARAELVLRIAAIIVASGMDTEREAARR